MDDAALPANSPNSSGWRARAALAAFCATLLLASVALWIAATPAPHGDSGPATAAAPVSSIAPLPAPTPPASPAVAPAASREELRQWAERHPRDGRSWALLAYAEFEAEAYPAAAAAFEKAVAVSPKVAADPGVLCDWADALGMAQGGRLTGRPAELVSRALALRPAHPKALEMAGSAAYERREFALAADYWRRLVPQLADGSAPRRALEDAVARAERLAGPTPGR